MGKDKDEERTKKQRGHRKGGETGDRAVLKKRYRGRYTKTGRKKGKKGAGLGMQFSVEP